MLRLDTGVSLVLSLVLVPVVAFAQEGPKGPSKADKKLGKILERQANKEDSGIDDDDLLDADLDDEAIAPVPGDEAVKKIPVITPSGELKTRIDREANRLGVRATAIGKELFEELAAKLKSSPKNTAVEIERRVRSCDERLGALRRQLAQIAAKQQDGDVPPPSSGGDAAGYGTPVVPYGRTPSGGLRLRVSASGQAQFKWWQKLLSQSMGGAAPALQKLVERRMNELKADADSLSLTVDPTYRPYADQAVRKAVETSTLGRGAIRTHIDRRLNDLFTFGKKRKTAKRVKVPAPRRRVQRKDPEQELTRFMGLSIQKFMLPRVKDPNTGRIRVFVNDPLGESPKR